MKLILFALSIAPLFGAPTVSILEISPTQVKVQVVDDGTPCTFQISEASSFTPLHPDVDATHFAGADTEAAHRKESWWNGSSLVRILLFGKRWSQVSASTGLAVGRSLAGDTVYWFKATCGSGNTTTTFKTASIRGIAPEEPPLDAAQFEQLAFPEFDDFTKSITDNKGSKLLTQDPNAWGSNRPAYISPKAFTSGGSGWTGSVIPWLGTGATVTNTNALFIALDTERSDPANTCGPLPDGCPYNDQLASIGGYWYDNWTDFSVDINGLAGSGTGNNAKVDLCLTIDSGQSCYTPHQTGTLPTGSAGPIQVPNTVDGSAANYPTAYFKGWGKRLDRKLWPHQGFVTVASSVVTLTKAITGPFNDNTEAIGAGPISDNSYFDITWIAGTKLWIVGSSAASSGACANDYCTIASVTDATHLTVSESVPSMVGDNFYQSAAFGVIIKRLNNTNTMTFSLRFNLAKSFPFNIGFYGGTALTTVTATDGAVGYPAVFPGLGNSRGPRNAAAGLFLITTTGPGSPEIRFISPFPPGGPCTNANSDCPPAGSPFGINGAYFNQSDPTKVYFIMNSQAAKPSIFVATYDAATYGWLPYSHWHSSYGSASYAPPNTSEVSYTNITTGANDIQTQVHANVSGYDASIFGTLPTMRSTMGPFALMDVGRQNAVNWIHAFCIEATGPCTSVGAGKWYKSYNTMDSAYYGGTDPAPGGLLRYSGNHATVASFGSSDTNGYTFSLATHAVQNGDPGLFQGGPFYTNIATVKRGGVYTPIGTGKGTALPWPIDSTYENTCPDGLPADIVAMGAVTPYCVQVESAMPCNLAYANATEISLRPCPYSATGSYNGGFQLRDFFKDSALYFTFFQVGDNEGFKVITTPTLSVYPDFIASHAYVAGAIIKPLTNNAGNSASGYYFQNTSNCTSGTYPGAWNQTYSGTTTDSGGCVWKNIANLYAFYIQRDANPSYCTLSHNGVASPGQMRHADNWTPTMWPREGCDGGSGPVIDIVNDIYVVPNQNIGLGHGGMVTVGSQSVPAGQNPGLFNRIAAGAAGGYQFANRRPFADLWKSPDGEASQTPGFAGLAGNCCQSYIDAKAPVASESFKQYSVDFAHVDPAVGADLEYPGATLGANTSLTLQAGTTGVYKMTVSTDYQGGAALIDIKRSPIFAWAATHYFIDVSNPTTATHQITDAVRWVKCYAYKAGECRTGSAQNDFFISMPANAKWPIDYGKCTTSQMNVVAPCALSAANQLAQLRLVYSAGTDDTAAKQIYLGFGGSGPEHQQVYANFLPTPDGLYGFYPMLGVSGYHSGLMMIKMPDVGHLDAINRTTFVPVPVTGNSGQNVYVEFGYEEFGTDGVTKFYCTSRKENCTAGAATITEANPFRFATADTVVTTTGAYSIAIPAISQRTLVYHVVTGGSAGPSHWVIVP